MNTKRRALLAGVGAMLAMPDRRALAQAGWPDRPLRFVIGAAAGGASDIFLRMMETRLRERLGQPLVIDPRPGAGGMVGAEITAHAPPDGYTFFINHIASHGIGPSLYRKLSFDPLKDV
ncbi:MAG: tripartite tricarboxylate transporter substrate binding protein, partial [Acetobacteraceae bacterium]|nr:tripartite tricarboxylate transporter substrate binding protein [Acetobacteraceae bacterium]